MKDSLIEQVAETKKAARQLAFATSAERNSVLAAMAKHLVAQQTAILAANQLDLKQAQMAGLTAAMQDRLALNPQLILGMVQSLENLIGLADPLAICKDEVLRPNGLRVYKKIIPLGVILMIYESRPNVTVEAASLAFKSGNAMILRGGKEALHSNLALANCWSLALQESGFDPGLIRVISTPDRKVVDQLLVMDQLIDLVIPRGGESLIEHVVAHSKIPVVKHYKGVCHLFVDESADFAMAIDLLVNGKTQRPGVCNALEGVIVHQAIAAKFLPLMMAVLREKAVIVYGCERTRQFLPEVELADEPCFYREFLELKMTCKLVDGVDEAIAFIDRYGSHHTEVIVSRDPDHAERFVERVDASVVMVNASSRFSDGGELGLGAEIGISTSKVHAYGPMGLKSLTSEKFVVMGQGQVRG